MSKLVTLAGGYLVGIDDLDVTINDINPYSSLVANNGFIRTASTSEQFSSKFYYDVQDHQWLTLVASGGSFTHSAVERAGVLETQSTAGSAISIQTRQRFIYLPGNTNRFTAGINYTLQDDCQYRCGVFDDDNGFFFEISKVSGQYQISLNRRSSASGTAAVESVPQSAWNIDKMDGTGPSGKTLDLTKTQMLCIEYTWYGAGGAVFGFEIDRRYYFTHWFSAGNRLTEFINANPELPIRHELLQTNNTTGNSAVKLGGAYMGIDGALDQRKGYPRGFVTTPINVSNNTSVLVLVVRPKLLYKSLANSAHVILKSIDVFGTAEGTYSLQYDITNIGGTWADVDTNHSVCEVSVDSDTLFTPGVTQLAGGQIRTSNRGVTSTKSFDTKEPLVAFSDGSGAVTMGLVFNCTGAGTVGAAFNWKELY